MVTWAEARTKVRGDLWRPGTSGVPDDVCDRALHSSILEIESWEGRNWLWLEGIHDSSAVMEETDQIVAPSQCAHIETLSFRRSASSMLDPPLQRQVLATVRELASSNTSRGAPSCYAFSGGEVFFDTKLPVGSSLELIWTARTSDDLAAAVAAGDTNVTLQRQQVAVIAGACAHVCLTYLKKDDEAQRQRAAFERVVERLCTAEDAARDDLTGGLVQPFTYYQDVARRG